MSGRKTQSGGRYIVATISQVDAVSCREAAPRLVMGPLAHLDTPNTARS